MMRTLFVGDLTNDPTRRDRATELMALAPQFGLEPLDGTVKLVAAVTDGGHNPDPSALRLSETAHRVEPWLGSNPRLLVGFDPLHTAMAMHCFPGTPVVLHVDGMGSGLPKLSLTGVSRLPGLYEVLTGTLRGASHVLVSNPRNASELQKQWGVDPQRIHVAPLQIGLAAPYYLEATRSLLTQTPTRFHWWMDLWYNPTPGSRRLA